MSVLGVALLFLHFKQRDTYRREACFSSMSVAQWKLIVLPDKAFPLTPQWRTVSETRFRWDFFPGNHQHEWRFAQGSPYFFFGTTWGSCAIGAGRHVSDLCYSYEEIEKFREFIQKKIEVGAITRSNFIALATSRERDVTSPKVNEAKTLLDEFYGR